MSNYKNIEIEIQVQIENIKPLIKFLDTHAKKESKTRQIDEYFTPQHRNFVVKKPVSEWLRLRNDDNHYSITYKYWHHDKDGKSHHCDEYETKIEDIKQLELIFKVLDIKPLVKVDKIRTSYLFKDYEISIDHVADLGNFVEIEYKGKSDGTNAKVITDKMGQFLKNLKLGKIYKNNVGYAHQLLFHEDLKVEEI